MALRRRSQLQIARRAWALQGLNLLVTLAVEGGPISNAPVEDPYVYEVEVIFLVHPFTSAVVNLEAEIRGGEVRLNG